jgi:hypothetical protein
MGDERYTYAVGSLYDIATNCDRLAEAPESKECGLDEYWRKSANECRAAIAKLSEPEKTTCDIDALLSTLHADRAAGVRAMRDAAKGTT